MCGSTREWIYCILDIFHILEWTVLLCKLSEYLHTDILCHWTLKGSQDKDILCYWTMNGSQVTGHRYLCVSGHWTDHSTDCWIQWAKLTVSYMDRIMVRSDWLHYCIIVCTIESISVDCNCYF